MSKIMVTGANGLLGQHLVKRLLETDATVIATGRGRSRVNFSNALNLTYVDLDLQNSTAVEAVIKTEKPAIIVHGGAMTQIDECEKNHEICFDVNVHATANLLLSAEEHNSFFIFLSTDFVFDGERGNYREDDDLNPVSWYGFTKVQAESLVETSNIPWSIVRTCLVYGNTLAGQRTNIVTWVKSNLEDNKTIQVVSDQVRTPTYIEDLVDGIMRIITKRATGIFHIAGKDRLTPYDMAQSTAHYFSLNENLIQRADASSFSQPAKRPLLTGLDISKARDQLGYEPRTFEEGLRRMFE